MTEQQKIAKLVVMLEMNERMFKAKVITCAQYSAAEEYHGKKTEKEELPNIGRGTIIMLAQFWKVK